MNEEAFDAAVLGAGPAGAATAAFLSDAGFRVALIDKARFPRHKPCGEGVMPAGIPVLRELGILREAESRGRRFHGIEFIAPSGNRAAGYFPEGRYGLAVPRHSLDWLLLEQVRRRPGVRWIESGSGRPILKEGRVVGVAFPEETIRADLTVIAEGATSSTLSFLGHSRILPSRRRYGMRTHFDGVEGLRDVVEVHLLPDAEIYLAPQSGTSALVSVLVEERALGRFAGRTQEAFLEMIESCAPLKDRLRRAEQKTKILGAGPLGGRTPRWHGPGWLAVGDAASSVDPITGEGISLALRNARLAAQEMIQMRNGRFSASRYAWRRRRMVWKKHAWSRILLAASRREAADGVIGTLARHPNIFNYLLSDC